MPFQLQPFNKKTILIGAGFSRNWGGRLAREMWEDIFSNRAVQSRSATRALMLRNPFFEDALAEVLDTKLYLDEDRAALNSAIQDAFERMDSEHAAKFASGQPAIDLGGMKDLIARFRAPAHNNVGYVFSLNQDVLFERLESLARHSMSASRRQGIAARYSVARNSTSRLSGHSRFDGPTA